jgi:hypothetical protein
MQRSAVSRQAVPACSRGGAPAPEGKAGRLTYVGKPSRGGASAPGGKAGRLTYVETLGCRQRHFDSDGYGGTHNQNK